MILAWLCYYDGLIAIAAVAAGIISAHYGMTAPFFGFQLMLIGLVFAVLALLSGLIAFPMTYFSPRRRAGLSRARIGLVLALMFFFRWFSSPERPRQYPLINDITTDTAEAAGFRES